MEEQFVLRVPPSIAERIDRLLNESASSSHDQSLDLSFSEDGRSGTFVIGDDHFPASLLDLPSIVESYKTYDDNVLIKTADVGQMIMVREEGDPAPDGMEYRHGVTPPMRDARRRRFRREPDLNPELVQRVEKDLLNIMNGGTAIDILAYHRFHLLLIIESLHFDLKKANYLFGWMEWNQIPSGMVHSIPFHLSKQKSLFFSSVISVLFHCSMIVGMYSLTWGLSESHMDMTEQDEVGEGNGRNTMKKAVAAPAAKPDVSEAGPNAGEPDRSDSDESDYSI